MLGTGGDLWHRLLSMSDPKNPILVCPRRRAFLQRSATAVGAATLLPVLTTACGGGGGGGTGAEESSGGESGGSFPVALADVPEGVTLFEDDQVFLVRGPEGIGAMSAVSPHAGGPLYVDGDEIACEWHASKFAFDGANTAPPASEPLGWLPVSVEGGMVSVDFDGEVAVGTFTAV